ncbi:MAG: 2Fe-2S iron-sulfur cluster-binding protein [Flavobacteriaceae bacterium]
MGRFHSLSIQNIRKETSDTVSISFNIPENLKADYSFIPGQYLTFRTNIEGKEIRRSYSICSSPNSNELRVAVKQINYGVFSTYANTILKEGEHLDVAIPEGKFILNTSKDNKKTYGAFAAGSGITPVIAMIKAVLENEPKSSFVLMYGNKSSSNTIFHDELNALKKEYFGRFFLYYTYTQTDESEALSGRIDKEKVHYIVQNKHKSTEFDSFYLCGPEDMITLVSDELQHNHITKNQIHYELFTAASTNTSPAPTTTAFNGSAQLTILVDDEETTVTIKQDETLLDAALKNGVDAPYSCQGGVCSSCMCLVTEGEVQLLKNSILTDDEIEEGITLACQAIPKSASIKIDFDDV